VVGVDVINVIVVGAFMCPGWCSLDL